MIYYYIVKMGSYRATVTLFGTHVGVRFAQWHVTVLSGTQRLSNCNYGGENIVTVFIFKIRRHGRNVNCFEFFDILNRDHFYAPYGTLNTAKYPIWVNQQTLCRRNIPNLSEPTDICSFYTMSVGSLRLVEYHTLCKP